ncbi:MAG: histidinol-phosphate transaminase [Alphaproteobacteria bacterium]|nr:histidinol-phosphate transaminase [Alphaproteobacteria bacterium]MDE2041743.1 histidinol-phosphate transaminase [Alphaproteobacteria bacterium]MDE2340896.1 histidinol-phosphate transaminase [Alphaproteobacteria bacterium]
MIDHPLPKPYVMAIAPYAPGKSATGGVVNAKLSSNENPLGTSAAAGAAFVEAMAGLSRYPDPAATALRAAIAAHHGLEADCIICGTGSDELLHIACGAYAGIGDEVIYVRYGFSVYDIAARRVGAMPVVAPDRDYGTDVDALLASVSERTRVVFIANPNNPTGTFAPRGEIVRLHAGLRPDIVLVIDQAYAEYLDTADDDGALALARTKKNVFVTRTFSKIYGLAAERVGWGTGHPDIIATLHRIRAPFNVTAAGQAAAIAAVRDQAFVDLSRAHNLHWRNWLATEIGKLGNAGLSAIPSKANFLLVRFAGALTADTAYQGLMTRGYITRWLPGQGLPDALRISIGSEADMFGLVDALRLMIEGSA